jgi:hypothetical protein
LGAGRKPHAVRREHGETDRILVVREIRRSFWLSAVSDISHDPDPSAGAPSHPSLWNTGILTYVYVRVLFVSLCFVFGRERESARTIRSIMISVALFSPFALSQRSLYIAFSWKKPYVCYGEMKVYGCIYIFLRVHIKMLSIMHSADEILSFKGEENELFCGASLSFWLTGETEEFI